MKRRVLYTIFLMLIIAIIVLGNKLNLSETNGHGTFGGASLELKDSLLLINNKAIEEMTFSEITEHFGEPIETRVEKYRYPATEEYSYFAVYNYDSIDILFDLKKNADIDGIRPTDRIWSFELTGNKYHIGELRVGMTVDEYLRKFGYSRKYSLEDIDVFGSSDTNFYSKIDEYNLGALLRVLVILRPEGYYSEYQDVFYEQGTFLTKDGYLGSIGFALLIKNNKIDRIVYGYPTAS